MPWPGYTPEIPSVRACFALPDLANPQLSVQRKRP